MEAKPAQLEKHAEAVSAISQAVVELFHLGICRDFKHCHVAKKNSRRIWFAGLFEKKTLEDFIHQLNPSKGIS